LLPIAIEITKRYRLRLTANLEVCGSAEIACAIAEQDCYAVWKDASNGEVLIAIAIEITQPYRCSISVGAEECRAAEIPLPVTQQNRYVARVTVEDNGEILLPVAIEIADCY